MEGGRLLAGVRREGWAGAADAVERCEGGERSAGGIVKEREGDGVRVGGRQVVADGEHELPFQLRNRRRIHSGAPTRS